MSKRSVLMVRLEALGKVADERREQIAEQVYKLEAVFELMANASASGYRVLKVQSPQPIDLSASQAAHDLVAQLKEAGARVEWVARQPTDPSIGERFSELVIRW